MKPFAVLTFALAAAVSATTAPCAVAFVEERLKSFSWYNCGVALSDAGGKTWTNADCDALYEKTAAAIAAFEPACSIGGVDSTDFPSLDPKEGIMTIIRASGLPSPTKASESAANTPAPTKATSSATATGAGLAFTALALAASMA